MTRLEEAISKLTEEELDLLESDPELLAAFKAKFGEAVTTEKVGDKVLSAVSQAGKTALDTTRQLGRMVEAGAAGTADITLPLLERGSNIAFGTSFEAPSFLESAQQAAKDIELIRKGESPETTEAKIGKFAGGFLTPTQIALQATGLKAAAPIAKYGGAVVKPVVRGLSRVSPKLSRFFGVAPETLTTLLESPEAVSTAKSLPETVKAVSSTIEGLSKTGIKAADVGYKALSATKAVPQAQEQLLKLAVQIAENKVLPEAAKNSASKYVLDLAQNIPPNASEKVIGNIVKELGDLINNPKWVSENAGAATEAAKSSYRILSNLLKSQNKVYAESMEKAAETFGPLEALKGIGLHPEDITINKLSRFVRPEALTATEQAAIAKFPGLASTVQNALAKEALSKSLAGQTALWVTPKVGKTTRGVVKVLPAVNAVFQGLKK